MNAVLDAVLAYTYVGVLVATIVDAIGVPFPGRLLLVAAGALAAAGDVSVTGVLACAAAGAVIGDHLWYFAGRARGEWLLSVYCRAMPGRRRCVDRAHELLARFGAFVFVIGRFVGGVRILAAPVAASAGIGYLQFVLADLAGAAAWSATFVVLGYTVGAQWPLVMERYGLAGSVAIAAVTVAIGAATFAVWRRMSRSSAARYPLASGRPSSSHGSSSASGGVKPGS
jgi:membrane protein DedA with SNARE-associated domain